MAMKNKIKSRQAKMQERIEQDTKERKDAIMKVAEEAGLNYVETELPPDEVKEEDVRRSLLSSLRSLIPYTNEWYESLAAEEELDNLSKIRIEKVKATDLLAQSRMGKHDNALDTMMSETNYDFFYFNKLKLKLEQEGKWNFQEVNLDPFKYLQQGESKNRLKKAINANFSLMDSHMSNAINNLATLNNGIDNNNEKKKQTRTDLPCCWRGKNKKNELLKCNNLRINYPLHILQENPNIKPHLFCCFHTNYCFSNSHLYEESIPIIIPNSESLCVECYQLENNCKPKPYSLDNVPGVSPANLSLTTNIKTETKKIELREEPKKNTKKTLSKSGKVILCQWIPNKNDEGLRSYICTNKPFIDPINNNMFDFCPFHLKECVRFHSIDATDNVITVPNQYGLCTMHYLAEYNTTPPILPIPYTGMIQKRGKDFWKSRAGSHWATPFVEPKFDIETAEYEEVEKPVDSLDYFFETIRMVKFYWHRRKLGLSSAIRIQRCYRRYRVHKTHLPLLRERRRRKRYESVLKIQTQMRIFLYKRRAKEIRSLYNKSTTIIQKLFRGYQVRMRLLIDWAAKRIQRFMKNLHFFKFRDSVIMIMQLRLMIVKKHKCAKVIQRYYRGYTGRCYVFNYRLWLIVSNTRAKKIQNSFRKYRMRCVKVTKTLPDEKWVLENCGRFIAKMIYKLYIDWKEREDYKNKINLVTPKIQRIIRGYLARCGTKTMRNIRMIIRAYLKPKYAKEFLDSYLEMRSMKYLTEKDQQANVAAIEETKDFIRNYLPDNKRNRYEVDRKLFERALIAWYKDECMPLLESEKKSLINRFKNPMNGTISLGPVEDYIRLHQYPCARHGRKVCGDCVYREHCMLNSCRCKMYKAPDDNKHGICINCDHPGTLHTLKPLQSKHANKETADISLLQIVNVARAPDLSIPVSVTGIPIEDAIVPLPDADDIRQRKQLEMTALTKKKDYLESTRARPMTETLASLEFRGDKIANSVDYWGQHGSNVLAQDRNDGSIDIKLKVPNDSHPPEYDVTPSVFWTLTSKNPNKKVADYHEKFEHNMPVPIINKGEIVYTFEGPKVYYNLVLAIIKLDKEVHYDNPTFLKLITEHIQIFERHWRKMVADIRQGKLDRNLEVSEDARIAFESTNLPRPTLAKRLDSTFRTLGFHKKVLGKDIEIRPYAQKKRTVNLIRANQQPVRKYSNPNTPSYAIRGEIKSAKKITMQESAPMLKNSESYVSKRISSPTLGRSLPMLPTAIKTDLDIFDNSGKRSRVTSPANLMVTTSRASTSSSRAIATPTGSKTPSRRNILAALTQNRTNSSAESSRAPTAQTPSRMSSRGASRGWSESGKLKRVGSDSDLLNPPSDVEIRKLHYEQETAARHKSSYKYAVKADGDRFICPFPACGKSFHSRDAAFRHLPEHEQKNRLYAPTPLPDSHMSFYWPTEAPWKAAGKYTERSLPPGSIRCSISNCKEVFATKQKLENHMRLIHQQVGNSSLSLGYFNFSRDALLVVPPGRPPPLPVPLRWCDKHVLPAGKCPACVEIESQLGPKPPFKFFTEVTIDMEKRRKVEEEILGEEQRPMTGQTKIFIIIPNEWKHGVVISSKEEEIAEWKGRVVAVILDRNNNCWVAVQQLYGYYESLIRNLDMPEDFNQKHELFFPVDGTGGIAKWKPIYDIVRIFTLFCKEPEEMEALLDQQLISRVNTYFVRRQLL